MIFDLEAKDHFTGDGIWLQDHFMGEGIWTHNPDFLQTLEHQAFELHLSDVPLFRKTWDGHFFKKTQTIVTLESQIKNFPPLSPSTWNDVYKCTYTSIKQKYMYICIYIYTYTCNAWPWNGKPQWTYDFKDKVRKRMQYTYVMQCKTHILYW